MKKIILLAAAVLLLGGGTSAQFLRFGAKGGINFNTFDVSNVNNFIEGTQDKPGWHLGLTGRINLGGLYVQPELLYNSNTYSYEYQFPTGQYTSDASSASVRNATLELPVMVGFKILFLRLEAGPSFTLGNWDDIKSGDLSGLGIDFKSPVTGYQAGLGAEFGKFSIGLRYAGYFSRTEQTFTLPDHTTQQLKSDKNGRFMLSLGYFF